MLVPSRLTSSYKNLGIFAPFTTSSRLVVSISFSSISLKIACDFCDFVIAIPLRLGGIRVLLVRISLGGLGDRCGLGAMNPQM